jgi:hypothetical protein
MIKKVIALLAFVCAGNYAFSQDCNCQTELKYVAGFMEKNYAGFKDKQAIMTKAGYDKMLNEYLMLSAGSHSREKCLLIISQYLKSFKDHHVSIALNFDAAKLDSAYMAAREIVPLTDEKIAELRRSKGFEGIYDFHDAAKYKIAVMKDKSPLHDYMAVIVSSNLPGWKRGMIKWEGKLTGDSVVSGVLYMLNGMPKTENFYFAKDAIWFDWHREGTNPARPNSKYEPVAFRKLSNKTLYLKISSFDPSHAKNIDSIVKANQAVLLSTPNLVLDLRDNGGGADYAFGPLMNLVYTGPVKLIGNDLLSTDANIAGWKNYLNDDDLQESNRKSIESTIKVLTENKGKLVLHAGDNDIQHYPAKVVILINRGCASSTDQFLLFARESKKVTLMGESTSGTLDYSNVVKAPFSCMPYILRYSTSRSRRVDVGQGVDYEGIKPKIHLKNGDDWITEAQKLVEH